ncbi:hypothetical protein HY637_02995 [Candidatus Woesearchaeota archaeon]|nr:hypothetical protein [Candidatus Woesearchaeota archaeon]
MKEHEFTNRSLSYAVRSKSPLANKLRSEYRTELDHIMERLPSLQVESFWNEILLYTKLDLNSLNSSRPRGSYISALKLYQLPEITETPTANFLHFPLANVFSRQPIQLEERDREYLDEGRQFAEKGYLGASSSAELIRIVSKSMGQFAQAHGIDVSGRIDYANQLAKKLEGGKFIEIFEWITRERLYRLAREGQALRAFGELNDLAESARKYNVPLDLLLSRTEIAALKAQAVNHHAFGLRGELLDIVQDVAAGNTWRRLDLERTDDLVPFCDDPAIVDSYNLIRSAVEHLASGARKPYAGKPRIPSEPLAIPAGPAVETLPKSNLIASIPFNPRAMGYRARKMASDRRMTSDDARTILSMFVDGDYKGIQNYGLSGSDRHPANGADTNRYSLKRVTVAALMATAIAAAYMLPDSGNATSQKSGYKWTIQIDCTGIQPRLYGQTEGMSAADAVREGLLVECKPGTEPAPPRGNIHLPAEEPAPAILVRRVNPKDTLTDMVHTYLGVSGGGPIYRKALDVGRDNNLANPDRIRPGDLIVLRR